MVRKIKAKKEGMRARMGMVLGAGESAGAASASAGAGTRARLVKEGVKSIGAFVVGESFVHAFAEANRLKFMTGLYFAAFISVLVLMLGFAYALFIYEPAAFMWRDGTTVWGVIVTRMSIFIPLIILAWFLGLEARHTKERCEAMFALAFGFKEAGAMIEAKDKKEFLLNLLISFLERKKK